MSDPDPSFERYVRLIRTTLRVPVGVVSVAGTSRQAPTSAMPFQAPFWRHALAAEGPLVVGDARTDPRVPDDDAVDGVAVVAYAGHPLVDERGSVVGALCAVDDRAREWTPDELAVLTDLAGACAAELAAREQRRAAQETEHQAVTATLTTSVLLALSQGLADTRTLPDIAATLHGIALDDLGAMHAGIWLLRDGQLHYVDNPDAVWEMARKYSVVPADRSNVIGAAVSDGRNMVFRHPAQQDAAYPAPAERLGDAHGAARAILPLAAAGEVIGVLGIVWPDERDLDDSERTMLAALTRYVAQAIQRAILLQERASAAATLQSAMLTDIPQVPGLEFVARYRTAAQADRVGGDWYDVVPLGDGATALVVGDVVGHDMTAAAAMGQLRSLLRAFVWDGTQGPEGCLRRLDRAARDLAVPSLATVLLGVLDAADEPGDGRRFRWTNAGHPAPIVLAPDGTIRSLDGPRPDTMLGVRPDAERSEWSESIVPGSTIVLFTDGLLESFRTDIDTGRALLVDALDRHRDRSLDACVDRVLDDLLAEHPTDDVAVLAVRLPGWTAEAQRSSERV